MTATQFHLPPAEANDSLQLCAFRVGDEEYVLDIMRIEEILQPHPTTRVAGAPEWVQGVINLRGAIIPVVELRKRLQSRGAPPPKLKPKFLVCRIGRRRVALLVDGVTEVIRVGLDELKPAPGILSGGHAPFVLGVCGPPDRLRLLLDVKATVAKEPER
ncbi:MAG: chemotaxis protein CheW [Myxococcaceae bacterium]